MFHLVLDDNTQLMITPCLDKAKEFFAIQAVLTPAAPIGVLLAVRQAAVQSSLMPLGNRSVTGWFHSGTWLKRFFFRSPAPRQPENDSAQNSEEIKRRVLERAHALYPKLNWRWEQNDKAAAPSRIPVDSNLLQSGSKGVIFEGPLADLYAEFVKRTRQRVLSPADFERLARELEQPLADILLLAQLRVEQGYGNFAPAITGGPERWQCQRCGGFQMEEWPSIYGPAATCKECIALGALSSLDFLYYGAAPNEAAAHAGSISQGHAGREKTLPRYLPSLPPTVAQAQASREILNFMEDDKCRRLLLWAACGAGKTEVVFPALEWALQRGLSVLFAAPRRDVIHDIAPRIERDFPGLSFQLLTGASPTRFDEGELVLATTHQVLRFRQGFDLIVLDELDAFPYSGSRMLAWGMEQARKADAKMIYLTATPDKLLRRQAAAGEIKLVRLPARHHGHPLPVPEWLKARAISHEHLDRALQDELTQLANQGPVLVFVPTIGQVPLWTSSIRKALPHLTVCGSHSSDPERRQKIERFLSGDSQIFVATTILERGVTFPRVQVVVLQADHRIFDERALVQMAGRAGRTAEYPSGRVLFVAPKQTAAMLEAVRWIEEQNQLARAQGLIV